MDKVTRVSFYFATCIVIYIVYATLPNLQLSSTGFSPFEPFLSDAQLSAVNQTKTVLLVSSELWGFRFQKGRLGFVNAGCEVNNCVITSNRSYVPDNKFDAFVIHVPTQRHGLWILPNRTDDQIFVFFSTEPPAHMPHLDVFENYFNWTISYLASSFIHLPYGRIEPLTGAPATEWQQSVMRQHIVRSGVNPALGKSKLAVAMISNCGAASNRLDYIQKLKKFVGVDIVSSRGRCGGVDLCPKNRNDDLCYDWIERTYKFYLAFENSICDEYVTEKFFNAIGRNIIPVVLGGANYSSIAPPHSYINALDYSPHQLAEYLTAIDRNDSLYAEYFWWKPHYRVVNLQQTNQKAFCELCAALHAKPMRRTIATGLQRWYHTDSHCRHKPQFESA